ncbi:MAG TPA: LuxR C-terminal-related transcriptional regulator, partial [Candidatus Saccharimonadales bacterium]
GLAVSWLYKTAHFKLLSKWRELKRRQTTSLEDMPEIFEADGADYRATLELVMRAVATLSFRRREVAARLLVGATTEEISDDLGIPAATVRVHRTLLRRDIEAKLGAEGLDIKHYRKKPQN